MKQTIVLFSGGSDSTLAAALELEAGRDVLLLTLDRISFIGAKNYTKINRENLRRIYGAARVQDRVVPVDDLHKQVNYSGYVSMLRRFGTATAALCFSKIAMHWAAARIAKAEGFQRVVDGSVPYMELYPDQNKKIAHESLRKFYQAFGVEYATPVYERSEGVELQLYDRGLITSPRVRGTATDFQVYYLEQVLLALFLKFYLTIHSKKIYEERFAALYSDRLDMIVRRELAG